MFSISSYKEHLTTAISPDHKYQIDFYHYDSGAKGTWGITGVLKGPLWFKKNIYIERRLDQVEIEWENNHTTLINGHKLDLEKGGIFTE